MRDISAFDVDDVRECSDVIRRAGERCGSMDEAATRIVRYLYDELGDGSGERACALVRLYKTHRFGSLDADLQSFVRDAVGGEPEPDVRCLTLLGTVGDEPEWNDRRLSVGHRSIPLLSEELVRRLPMVTQLITQLGLDIGTVVQPRVDEIAELSQRTFDVFHVPQAAGSPHIPAQHDFVEPYGIASALGFGGVLYTGDFYAVVVFSKVAVGSDAAQLIKILSLAIRVPLLAHLRRVFAPA